MEMLAACFKGRFVHVNVNYRYVDEELYYIFDNSDAEAVLYAREFAPQVEALKARLPKVKCFIEVSDDTDVVLDGALSYEALAQNGDGSPGDSSQRRRFAVPLYWRHHRHAEGRDVGA